MMVECHILFLGHCDLTSDLVLISIVSGAYLLLFAAFEAANFQIDFFGNPVMRTAD